MTRLRQASVIAVLFSLAWAWILWSQGVRNKMTINWFTVGAYASYNECRTALQDAAENLQNSGYELVDTSESITAIKDNDNFTGLTCFPDTADPRGPKGSGRRESPRRVLRRRTGCGGVVVGRVSGRVRDRNDAAIDERTPASGTPGSASTASCASLLHLGRDAGGGVGGRGVTLPGVPIGRALE